MVLDKVPLSWKGSKIAFRNINFSDFCRRTKLAKNGFFLMLYLTPSNKGGSNLKLYYERSLSEFHENGKKKLPSTIND